MEALITQMNWNRSQNQSNQSYQGTKMKCDANKIFSNSLF